MRNEENLEVVMKKASEKTRSKIVRKIGAVLATVALTAGVVVGGVGIAKEQARIDKYVDDKDGSQLATVLMEDLNENLQEQGVDYQFENPQYRAMIAHKKNKVVFLKSWNEWGEGNYMEPCLKYGHGYIEALSQALKEN